MTLNDSNSGGGIGRRTFLEGAAGVAALGVGATVPAAAQSAFGGWFDDVSNYDGVVDRTGQSEVTVSVGAPGNNGNFAFGPAAVRVDPGTTVVWEWTGKGSTHNVVAEDGSFESEMTADAGHAFEHTFEGTGVTKYACTPHKAMGMKGAIVVGDDAAADAPAASASQSTTGSDGGSGDGGSSGQTDGGGDGSGDGGSGGSGDVDLASWFDDVSNYDGVVDYTGESEVTVEVGAPGNNGNFAFGPAAIRVDPGTTVVWEWTGKGGDHNVVAEGGAFESELVGDAGHAFERTFEEAGAYRYACTPHETLGMKGAIVVGDDAAADAPAVVPQASGGRSLGDLLTLGFAGALVAGLLGLPLADQRSKDR